MSREITKEKVISAIYKKGYKPLEFDFNGYKDYVLFMDNNGYEYRIQWSKFIVGDNFQPFYSANPFALDNIKQCIQNENLPVELLCHKYKNSTTKMLFRDKNGHLFKSDWNSIYNRHNFLCPKCYLKNRGLAQRLNVSQYKNLFEKFGFTILDESQILYNDTLIDVIDNNGYKGQMCYSNLKQRRNTTFIPFIKSNPFVIENIKHFIDINNLNIKLLDTEYIGCNVPMKFKCSCGNIMYKTWDTIKQMKSISCDKCHNKSIIEKIVGDYLENKGVKFISQYCFDDCGNYRPYPFDFYLPKYNVCIEVQGEQHYKPVRFGGMDKNIAESQFVAQIERDRIKEEYCISHNISLLKIKYDIIRNGKFKEIIDNLIC